MFPNLKINGYPVSFLGDKVIIENTNCSLTKERIQSIIRYLVHEGFASEGGFNILVRHVPVSA